MGLRQYLGFLFICVLLHSRASFAFPKKEAFGQGVMLTETTRREKNESSFSFVVEAGHHFKQKGTSWGIRPYGFSQFRFELGSPIGVTVDSASGLILYGLAENMEGFWPFLGAEPFAGRITWNSNSMEQHYYEWLPMMSAGLHFSFGSCFFLPVIKGGIGLGNLNQSDLFPEGRMAFGIGTHLNCDSLDLGSTLVRIQFPGQSDVLLSAIDIAVEDRKFPFYFGIRGELFGALDPSRVRDVSFERRVMLVIRSGLI